MAFSDILSFFAPTRNAQTSSPWLNLALGGLAGGSSLAGLIGNIYGGVQQRHALDNYLRAAHKTIDPRPYLQQITDVENRNMRNTVAADLAARGVQPGGYWDSQMMDASIRFAQDRMNQAYNRAIQAKTNLLTSLQQRPGALGGLSGGDTSAIGKYLQYLQEQQTRNAARKAEADRTQRLQAPVQQQNPAVDTRNLYPQGPQGFGGDTRGMFGVDTTLQSPGPITVPPEQVQEN